MKTVIALLFSILAMGSFAQTQRELLTKAYAAYDAEDLTEIKRLVEVKGWDPNLSHSNGALTFLGLNMETPEYLKWNKKKEEIFSYLLSKGMYIHNKPGKSGLT